MKKILLLICFFPLFVFASYTQTIVIQAQGDNNIRYQGSIQAVPCTVTVNVSGGRAGVGNRHDTTSSAQWSYYDDGAVGLQFWAHGGSNNPADTDLTATFVIEYTDYNPNPDQHQTQYGHPLNACPMGCGVCLTCTPGHAVWNSELERLVYGCENPLIGGGGGGGGGGDGGGDSDAPWARESSLQSLISGFSSFGNTWAQWASSVSGKFDTSNQRLSGIQNQLTSINSQQINNQQTFASYMDSLFNSYLNPLKDKADTANSHLNDLNGKADTANSHLNDLKGKADITNQNVSDTRQFTEQIKESLNPSNVTSPTMETPLDDITPNTSSITTLKNKLLPRYSFFTNPGGSQFPEWSFTLPLQSFGWRDFTITFGGASWSTVGGGILLTLMQFTRTLSKFVFYFIFLRCIILYLRQW